MQKTIALNFLKLTAPTNQIAVFEQQKIRCGEHAGALYFAIIDVITILAETDNPRQYWTKIKRKLTKES